MPALVFALVQRQTGIMVEPTALALLPESMNNEIYTGLNVLKNKHFEGI